MKPNLSHAAAYALTAYCGAWLKANYPTAFYTVALQWCEDKEIPLLMSEMEACSRARIVPPDINISGRGFYTDYSSDRIFWSLARIKMLGAKNVDCIAGERKKNGEFTSVENFIHRIFKYKLKKYRYWDDPDNQDEAVRVPVNSLHVRHLVLSGCFDRIEGIQSVNERFRILEKAGREPGLAAGANDYYRQFFEKDYFWSVLQIAVSGIGTIDYRGIYRNSGVKDTLRGKAAYMSLRETLDAGNEGKRVVVCATVAELGEVSYTGRQQGEKKRFCKLKLRQNNDLAEYVFWSDYYEADRKRVLEIRDRIIIVTGIIKYNGYSGTNTINSYKHTILNNI
jgi:DNA polymerase-3 subunit alpha